MKHTSTLLATLTASVLVCNPIALAQADAKPAQTADAPAPVDSKRVEWVVDGVTREALVYAPATATTIPAPLIFAFHGHGGSGRQFARSGEFHTAWPAAIVVYPQGLPTAGMTDPKGLKAGWQSREGIQHDRDLKFFDAMLAGLKSQYKVDDRQIYSTGHSNGGGFTYLLWATRGEVFAAFGPSSAGTVGSPDDFIQRPLIHIAGESDAVVPVAFQQRTVNAARTLNECETEGTVWAEHCTLYPSKHGAPVVMCLQPGGHNYYEHATELIVRFFKEHQLPPAAPAAPVTPATP